MTATYGLERGAEYLTEWGKLKVVNIRYTRNGWKIITRLQDGSRATFTRDEFNKRRECGEFVRAS